MKSLCRFVQFYCVIEAHSRFVDDFILCHSSFGLFFVCSKPCVYKRCVTQTHENVSVEFTYLAIAACDLATKAIKKFFQNQTMLNL